MVWGLEKLWPSGSSAAQSSTPAPAGNGAITSNSAAPLVTATVPIGSAQTPVNQNATPISLSPALAQRLKKEEDRDWFSARSRKQFTLFAAGATFLLLSTRITRRQVAKRALKRPALFKPSNNTMDISVNGPVEAVEALSLASVNVLSFTMMMTGGLLWAFDISSIDDLRRKIRGGLGVDGTGRNTEQVEEEFEEWLATVLDRKRSKEEQKTQSIAEDERVQAQWRNERGKSRGV